MLCILCNSLPVFMTQMINDCPLWSLPTAIHLFYDPVHLWVSTATVDPTNKKTGGSLGVSLFLTYLSWQASRTSYWASSLLMFIGSLYIWGKQACYWPYELGSPVLMGVDLICNKGRLTSWLVARHFWLHISQIFYMPPPDYCSGDDRMMLWTAICSYACKIVWMSLMWSSCLHLKWSIKGVNNLQIFWSFVQGHLLQDCPYFSQQRTLCSCLQYTEAFHY